MNLQHLIYFLGKFLKLNGICFINNFHSGQNSNLPKRLSGDFSFSWILLKVIRIWIPWLSYQFVPRNLLLLIMFWMKELWLEDIKHFISHFLVGIHVVSFEFLTDIIQRFRTMPQLKNWATTSDNICKQTRHIYVMYSIYIHVLHVAFDLILSVLKPSIYWVYITTQKSLKRSNMK